MNELFYGEFYGLDSPPFHTIADSSLLFATETHHHALAAIEYGIASGKGFIVITGEVGVGKTTVLRICLDRLDANRIKVIYVFNPFLDPLGLYETILEELDAPPVSPGRPINTLHRLQRALLRAHNAGHQVIVAIDEAQNMPESTLEALRLLTNLETSRTKLLQIVLVGQPELEQILSKHTMRQLTQRVAVRAKIRSLTWRQTLKYILHRLQCAGRPAGRPLFTVPALWYLALASSGIPRTINICCDNALISGYGASKQRLSLKLVHESCRSLRLHSRLDHIGAYAIVVLLLTFIMFSGFSHRDYVERFVTNFSHNERVENKPARTEEVLQGKGTVVRTAMTEVEDHSSAGNKERLRPALAVPAADFAASLAVRPEDAPMSSHQVSSKGQLMVWKWFVRSGDTVTKLCRLAYGQCDEDKLQAIYSNNSQIGSDRVIRAGEVILLPDRAKEGPIE